VQMLGEGLHLQTRPLQSSLTSKSGYLGEK
jgi:hypothetical protein